MMDRRLKAMQRSRQPGAPVHFATAKARQVPLGNGDCASKKFQSLARRARVFKTSNKQPDVRQLCSYCLIVVFIITFQGTAQAGSHAATGPLNTNNGIARASQGQLHFL